MDGVEDKKLHIREQRYLVRWRDSVVRRDLIRRRFDGSEFVRIVGQDWEVEHIFETGISEDGHETCEVRWQSTWQPLSMLQDAKGAIADFERHRSSVLRFEHSTADARISAEVTPREDRPGTPPTRVADPPHLVWQPVPGEDYRAGYRRLIRQAEGDSSETLKKWPEGGDRRPLLFRGTGKFDGMRDEKKRAVFVHVSGIEQLQPCDSCLEGRGPFIKCVVAAGYANGACTNCACAKARKCNFHQRCES